VPFVAAQPPLSDDERRAAARTPVVRDSEPT